METFLQDIAAEVAKPSAAYENQGLMINMHALPTTLKLMDVLFDNGFRAENTIFFGKPYSTIFRVKNEICRRGVKFRTVERHFRAGQLAKMQDELMSAAVPWFLKRRKNDEYLLLDSGGHLTMAFDEVASVATRTSIQLTSSGSRLFTETPYRIVDIGLNKEKRRGEGMGIASVIYDQVLKAVPHLIKPRIAIIGDGSLGTSLLWKFRQYDNKIAHFAGTETNFDESTYDVIVGATGYDQSAFIPKLRRRRGVTHLFSASSWDVEFRGLLHKAHKRAVLSGNRHARITPKYNLVVHNAGCPINFNRKTELESERDIAVTRGLTLAAALDPVNFERNEQMVMQKFRKHYGLYAVRHTPT